MVFQPQGALSETPKSQFGCACCRWCLGEGTWTRIVLLWGSSSSARAAEMAPGSPGSLKSVLIVHISGTWWVFARNWVPAVKTQIYENSKYDVVKTGIFPDVAMLLSGPVGGCRLSVLLKFCCAAWPWQGAEVAAAVHGWIQRGPEHPGALSATDLHIRRKQKKQSLILSKPNNIMYIDWSPMEWAWQVFHYRARCSLATFEK